VSAIPRASVLAPFRVRSFRYQWPADLSTSWAFEMETLILGWYVLVETQSVLMLTVFASLGYLGTLLAPMFGVTGDRIGHRNLLCGMRAIYAALALLLTTLAFTNSLNPVLVLVVAGMSGLVRPSDVGMRAALVGETMPPERMMGAMSIQRTTQDSARIAGALTGAGLVAILGIGPTYLVVTTLYAVSVMLTLKAGAARASSHPPAGAVPASPSASPWGDLKSGLGYVWNTPHLLAMMLLAFLLNFTAFPLVTGLLPYVARSVYHTDQTGLGYLVAGASFGALLGSIALSRFGGAMRPARIMLVFCAGWYSMILVFAHTPSHLAGVAVLVLSGFVQCMGLVSMAALLLRTSGPQYRGRIMGIRMLALYTNIPGLLIAGELIPRIGYAGTATIYCAFGIACVALIAARWRGELWRADAPANAR